MQKIKVRDHAVQKFEWKRTDGGDFISPIPPPPRANAMGKYGDNDDDDEMWWWASITRCDRPNIFGVTAPCT